MPVKRPRSPSPPPPVSGYQYENKINPNVKQAGNTGYPLNHHAQSDFSEYFPSFHLQEYSYMSTIPDDCQGDLTFISGRLRLNEGDFFLSPIYLFYLLHCVWMPLAC